MKIRLKKILLLLITSLLCFSLYACAPSKTTSSNSIEKNNDSIKNQVEEPVSPDAEATMPSLTNKKATDVPIQQIYKNEQEASNFQLHMSSVDDSLKDVGNENTSDVNPTSNPVAPDSASQNSKSQNNATNNQSVPSTNTTDTQLLIQIKDIKKQTDAIIASGNKNMEQIDTQKSQVNNYISYIKKGSIVYNDTQLVQITTLLSKLTTDSQTVRNAATSINSDINMFNTFSNNKNFKNALIKLNDELLLLNTRIQDISSVSNDLTSTLALLVQGQAVGSIINQPTASPSTSILTPSGSNNTTN